jgi:hypothetical protein
MGAQNAATPAKTTITDGGAKCRDAGCPMFNVWLTFDQWRTINAPGPVSDRTREREELARELFVHSDEHITPAGSFECAVAWIRHRDEWRTKDGAK